MGIRAGSSLTARLVVGAAVAALASTALPVASVFAAVPALTPATGGEAISADTNAATGTGAYATLAGPVLTEVLPGDISTGNIVLNAPAGFEFKPGSAVASVGGNGCVGLTIGPASTVAATVTIAVNTASSTPCVLTITGLGARPTAGSPLQVGNITNTGTSGATGGTNYGTLTEVPGAPVLTFTSGAIANSTGGATLAPNPSFHDQDQFGNLRAADAVTLGIASGTGTAGAALTCDSLTGTTSAGGDVTFQNCKVDKSGTGYKLSASAGSSSVETNAFDVTVGPPAKLVFASYPGSATPTVLASQPSVAIADLGGNQVTSDNSTVVTIAINSNGGTFTCGGGLSKTASTGLAVFSGCTQTTAGTYTLMATSVPALTPITGQSFTISSSSGTATKLAFCWSADLACPSSPPAPVAGAVFASQPTIRVEDAAGNTDTTSNGVDIVLSLSADTIDGPSAVLSCTGGVHATVNAGIATFNGCKIDTSGTGFQITAASAGLTSATSQKFNVSSGAASKLMFVAGPPASVGPGAPFASSLKVGIADSGGHVIAAGISATISLTIGTNPSGGVLTCTGGTSAATSAGVATFAGCSIDKAGTGYTLVATATTTTPSTPLSPATSAAFNVGAAAVFALAFVPANGVILWGASVSLLVHGTGGAGQPVELQVSKDGNAWSVITSSPRMTDASGNASFAYRPSDNRYYRAVSPGSGTATAIADTSHRVVVRQLNQLGPAATPSPRRIHAGTKVVFTDVIRPARPELPQAHAEFQIYQLTGTTWKLVASQTVGVNAQGVATLTVTFVITGQFYLRSQAAPTTSNANSGWSSPVRYVVVA
jgi:hypothetical protein